MLVVRPNSASVAGTGRSRSSVTVTLPAKVAKGGLRGQFLSIDQIEFFCGFCDIAISSERLVIQ